MSYPLRSKVAIVGFLLGIFGFPISVMAQSVDTDEINPGESVSFLEVDDARILNSDERSVSVTFDIKNTGADVQTDVRYALELLIPAQDRYEESVIDYSVSDELLAVGGGERMTKHLSYEASPGMAGRYLVRVIVESSSGFPFGYADVGEVFFASSGIAGVDLDPRTCFLTVGDEPIRYGAYQGVDIGTEEALHLHCRTNNSGEPLSVTPVFSSHPRSGSGTVVERMSEDITLPSGISELSLPVPILAEPGAYFVRAVLSVDKEEVSSPTMFRYVVQGAAPSVSSVRAVSGSSVVGDVVPVSFSVVGSPDQHIGSRSPERSLLDVSVRIILSNSEGNRCSDGTIVPIGTLDRYANDFFGSVDVPLVRECSVSSVSLEVFSGESEYFSTGSLPVVPGSYLRGESDFISTNEEVVSSDTYETTRVFLGGLVVLLTLFGVGVTVAMTVGRVRKRGGRGSSALVVIIGTIGAFSAVHSASGAGIALESWTSDDHVDRWHLHEIVSAPVGQWTAFVGDDGNSVGSDDQAFKVRGQVYGPAGGTFSLESWVSDDHVDRWHLHEIVSAPTGAWTAFVGDDGNSVGSDDQAFKIRSKLDDNAAGDYAGCSVYLESWTSDDHVDRWHLHEIVSAPVGQWTAFVGDDGNSVGSDDQAFAMRMRLDCPNRKPRTPSLSGPDTGRVGERLVFSVSASDPDGDLVRYGFDWNGDYRVDSWTSYGSSGIWRSVDHTWSDYGSKTYRVIAQDSEGALSDWVSGTVWIENPNVLRLCQNGFFYANGGETGSTVTLTQRETRALTVYYDSGSGCSGTDVTASTVFSSSSPTVGVLSGDDPKILTGGDLPRSSDPGRQTGASTIRATYSGQTAAMPLIVTELCVYDCYDEVYDYCSGESFSVTDSCGDFRKNVCTGARNCDFNWKEVVPGE